MNSMTARLLTVLVGVVLMLSLARLMRRRVDFTVLEANNSFAGAMYSMIGLVYGVYLAFTIIAVWEQFSAAGEIVTAEATSLSALWRDAQVMPPEDRTAIQGQLLRYTESVVSDEWQTMARAHGPAVRTSALYEELWRHYYRVQLDGHNVVQSAFYQESISRLNDLGLLRRRRLLAADSELPRLMWILLVSGGVVTVLFALVFGTRHAWIQYVIIAIVTALVTFSILLVDAMQYPFSGDVSITPEPYSSVVVSMRARAPTAEDAR